MSDLRIIHGGDATTPADANGHGPPADAFARLDQANATPKATTDDTGRAMELLQTANVEAGLARENGDPIESEDTPAARILRAIRRGEGNAAVIDLEFENGERASCTAKQLYDPRHMDAVLTQATLIPPDWRTPKEWRPFAIAVLQAAEPDNATDSETSETCEWLAAFVDETTTRSLTAHTPGNAVPLDDPAKLFDVLKSDDGAFRGSDDRLYVRPPQLLQFVSGVLRQRTTSTELRARLGRLGFTKPRNSQGQLAARKGDETVTRRYLASTPGWELP